MKTLTAVLAIAVLAACSAAPEAPPAAPPVAAAPAEPEPSPDPAPAPAEATRHASGTAMIESIDVAAGKVTLAHDAIPALEWPGMTMTFDVSGVDLAQFQAGDAVAFEIDATGMGGTITSMSKQ